jgi:uncharacterized membrane protein HdeD (DUF308 family)
MRNANFVHLRSLRTWRFVSGLGLVGLGLTDLSFAAIARKPDLSNVVYGCVLLVLGSYALIAASPRRAATLETVHVSRLSPVVHGLIYCFGMGALSIAMAVYEGTHRKHGLMMLFIATATVFVLFGTIFGLRSIPSRPTDDGDLDADGNDQPRTP